MTRGGFTLVEMLVATTVFVIGFTACFGLFLVGSRHRAKAEDELRLGLATASLLEAFRTHRPAAGSSRLPSAWLGDGFPDHDGGGSDGEAIAGQTLEDIALYPAAGHPGVWYRVLAAADIHGDAAASDAPTIHMRLLLLHWATGDTSVSLADVTRRYRIDPSLEPDEVIASIGQQRLGWLQSVSVIRR